MIFAPPPCLIVSKTDHGGKFKELNDIQKSDDADETAAAKNTNPIPDNQCALLERILRSTSSAALEKIHRMFVRCQQNTELVKDIEEYLRDVMGMEFTETEFSSLIEHCVNKNKSGWFRVLCF